MKGCSEKDLRKRKVLSLSERAAKYRQSCGYVELRCLVSCKHRNVRRILVRG